MAKRRQIDAVVNSRYGKPARKTRVPQAPSWAEETLALQIRLENIAQPTREYSFDRARKWRFDFAWPDYLIAVEVEGGVRKLGRHQRPEGFERDCEKYNQAQVLGWAVLRYTPAMIRRGEVMGDLIPLIFARGAEQEDQKIIERAAIRLLTLSTKWCDKDHHDWTEIIRWAHRLDQTYEALERHG